MFPVNQRKLFFALAQQNRAAVHRHHVKDRIENLANQFLCAPQPTYARADLDQNTQVPGQPFVLTEIDHHFCLVQKRFRPKLLSRLINRLRVIKPDQMIGRSVICFFD